MSSIKLKHSGGNSVSLNPPTSAPTSSEVAFKLPNADGSAGQVLKTDGNGNLSWVTPSKILQVVQSVKTDSFSYATAAYADVTGMTATITPSSSSNKILVKINLVYGGENNAYFVYKLLRGSTHIGQSTAVSLSDQLNGTFVTNTGNNDDSQYKAWTASYEILDTPSTTSATTYKIQVYSRLGRGFRLNRPYNNDNYDYIMGGSSTITLMEIAA